MSLIFQITAFERVAVGRKYTKLEVKVLIDISPSIFGNFFYFNLIDLS